MFNLTNNFTSQKARSVIENRQQLELDNSQPNYRALNDHFNENEILHRDIESVKESYSFIHEILDTGIFTYDYETGFVLCNAKFLQMIGFKNNRDYKNIFSGSNVLKNVHHDDVYALMSALRAPFFDKSIPISCTIRLLDENGIEHRSVKVTGKYRFDKDKIVKIGLYLSDVTELNECRLRVKELEHHDALTGLPNRVQFEEYINLIISKKLLSQAAFIYLDIDNFKYVNNTFGHLFGDNVIVEVSGRIIDISPECMVARLGGDEFGIFYMNYRDIDEVTDYISKLLKSISIVYSESGLRQKISASVGISLYPFDSVNFETLLKNSDIAMYISKMEGKNKYTFFTEKMTRDIQERFMLEENLSIALEKNEFVLYYQPLLSVESNRIVGFEALIRWYSVNGIIYPDQFISASEKSGHIIPIGYYVLEEACKFIKTLQEKNYNNIHVAVNISSLQLMQKDFVPRLFNIIDSYGINTRNLELEITESLLIESFDTTVKKLLEITSKGIRISLDDFGTGYSSFTYLKELPVNTLKIDKSFIDNITVSDVSYKIVAEIINLAHILNIKTIAEGVETLSQAACLKEMGCDIIQGFLSGKPIPITEIYKLTDSNLI